MSGPAAIVLGLDGATLDLLVPWAEAGQLPNLKRLMDGGAVGKLRSTLPFVTALAWPSIYTGVNPGKHGLLAFRKRVPNEYRWTLNSFQDLHYPPMWDVLGAQGLRTAALFVPLTYPARAVNGTVVSGAFGPGGFQAGTVHPSELGDQLAASYGSRFLSGTRKDPDLPLRAIAERMVQGVRDETDVICDVLRRDPYDFVFMVWHDTDKAAHLFWHHSELPCPDLNSPLLDVYTAVDEGIGRVLEAAGGDPLVVVCSDHGTYPIRYRVQTHVWLWREGLLGVTPAAKAAAGVGQAWRQVPESVRSLVPVSVRRKVFDRLAKRDYQLERKRGTTQASPLPHIDWRGTSVYAAPDSAEAMWVNLAGREPQGIVAQERLSDVLGKLDDSLIRLETDEGERIVDEVHRRDDLYQGPWSHLGSDLVVEAALGTMFAPSVKRLQDPGRSEVISVPAKPNLDTDRSRPLGYHQRDGVVIFSGPGVKPGELEKHDLTELAPTLFRHLGVEMPSDLDGTGIETAFEDLPAAKTFARVPSLEPSGDDSPLTSDQEEEISKHLQDLGYIE